MTEVCFAIPTWLVRGGPVLWGAIVLIGGSLLYLISAFFYLLWIIVRTSGRRSS